MMTKQKIFAVISWVFAVLISMLFLLVGIGKLSGGAAKAFADWGYAPWFAVFIGVAEVLGAIGLLIPRLMFYAIAGLTLIMFGAAYTHLANGEGADVLRPGIFLAFLWLAWVFRTIAQRESDAVAEA